MTDVFCQPVSVTGTCPDCGLRIGAVRVAPGVWEVSAPWGPGWCACRPCGSAEWRRKQNLAVDPDCRARLLVGEGQRFEGTTGNGRGFDFVLCDSCCEEDFCGACGAGVAADSCAEHRRCVEHRSCSPCEQEESAGCGGCWLHNDPGRCREEQNCEACCREACGACSGCDRAFCRLDRCDADDCPECNECCNHRQCDECEHWTFDVCGECDGSRCLNCCVCGEENHSGVSICKRGISLAKPCYADVAGQPSRRLLGAEIEIWSSDEGKAHLVDKACREAGASVVKDGSLGEESYEICTHPAAGRSFCRQIESICTALAEAKAKATSHCGLHIHVDARDLRWFELRRLAILWETVDKAFRECVPDHRKDNRYCAAPGEYDDDCVPSYKKYSTGLKKTFRSTEIRGFFRKELYGLGPNSTFRPSGRHHGTRYRALNLQSYFVRGTVEFRLPPGTTKAENVVGWAFSFARLVDFANRATDRECEQVCSLGAWGALYRILQPSQLDWLADRRRRCSPELDDLPPFHPVPAKEAA